MGKLKWVTQKRQLFVPGLSHVTDVETSERWNSTRYLVPGFPMMHQAQS